MTQDDYLQRASASGPWILLREQEQEIKEIRGLLRQLMAASVDDAAREDDGKQELLIKSLTRRIDSIAHSSQSMAPFVVKYPEIEIYLADAAKVDRLNEDERMAGYWLAISTLFLGALLQTLMESSSATSIAALAAVAFGIAAGIQYWRARKALAEMHNTKWRPLFPGQLDPHKKASENEDGVKN